MGLREVGEVGGQGERLSQCRLCARDGQLPEAYSLGVVSALECRPPFTIGVGRRRRRLGGNNRSMGPEGPQKNYGDGARSAGSILTGRIAR